MSSQNIVDSAALDSIISGAENYPTAQMAAIMLRPYMRQLSDDLSGQKHVASLKHYSHVLAEILASVNKTIMQLQTQMFDLQKLAVQYPDQKTDLMQQHSEIKAIAKTLNQSVISVYELVDALEHGPHAGAKRA